MNGMRLPAAAAKGRLACGLLSLLALLALSFPVGASAQEDAAGVQYQDSIPRPEGDNSPQRESSAGSSKAKNGGKAQPGTTGPDSAGTDSSTKESSSPGGGADAKDDGGTGQGSSGSSADRKAGAPVQPGGQNASTSEDDDGSSPLVPILVAIFVLAGVSLAALLIRHRRQRDASAGSISPEAG